MWIFNHQHVEERVFGRGSGDFLELAEITGEAPARSDRKESSGQG